VSVEVTGVDITAVGVILMIVGIVGLVLSLFFWSSWGGSAALREAEKVPPHRRRP
jgi:heme/copper-type cytochrome/quinol oxidase subunit 2